MKKTMIFLGVLSLGLAQAQQNDPFTGKVGVNTDEPKATLDIKAHKADGTTKEGLLIPRMSKTAIAKIAQPETSTLIYVNDVNYTAGSDANANTRVAKIDAVGFYYYDGTQWIWKDKYEWDRKTENGESISYLINTYPENKVTYNKESGRFDIYNGKPRKNNTSLWVRNQPINTNGQKETEELFGSIVGTVQTQANTSFEKLNSGLINLTVADDVSVDEAKGLIVQNNFTSKSTNQESIGLYSRLNIFKGASLGNHTGVYSYVAATAASKFDNLYYFRTGQHFGNDTPYSADNVYGLYLGDINRGKILNYAIYSNAGQVRFGDLKGTGNRNVYADADGVLKVGDAGATQLSGTDDIECNDANRGKMNFKKDVSLGGGKTADAMGVCLKGSDGNYYWNYMYGNGGKTTGSNAFGTELQ